MVLSAHVNATTSFSCSSFGRYWKSVASLEGTSGHDACRTAIPRGRSSCCMMGGYGLLESNSSSSSSNSGVWVGALFGFGGGGGCSSSESSNTIAELLLFLGLGGLLSAFLNGLRGLPPRQRIEIP